MYEVYKEFSKVKMREEFVGRRINNNLLLAPHPIHSH